MNYVLLLSSLLIVASCDAPMKSRKVVQGENSNSMSTGSGFNVGNLTNPGSTTGETTPSNPASSVTSESGFYNCDISAKYSTADIGSFGICQSTISETTFKVAFTQITSTRNCLIPLYKDASGSSTYIGQPQCTAVNTAKAVINGNVYKDRSGFESYPLNGVIVMKESLLPNYFSCMNAYISWPSSACSTATNQNQQYCAYYGPRCTKGGQTNQECDTAARTYMNQICNNFKSQYSGQYADIRTR